MVPSGYPARTRLPGWQARLVSAGARSMPGMRRTNRFSSIPGIPTSASTRCARIGTSGLPSMGSLLPRARHPCRFSKQAFPARYYLDRTGVVFQHLVHSGTRTACPYKGRTSDCWPVRMRSRRNQCGSAMDCSATPAVHAQPRPMPGAAPGDYKGDAGLPHLGTRGIGTQLGQAIRMDRPIHHQMAASAWRPAR